MSVNSVIPKTPDLTWKKEVVALESSFKRNEAAGVIGIFGVGKRLFIEYLKNSILKENIIIEINLKDNAPDTNKDVYKMIFNELNKNKHISKKSLATSNINNTSNTAPQTDFEFHYFLKNLINELNKKITIVFLESQSLLKIPDSFWDNLESLLYYQKPKLQLIFVGQPGLINFSTQASRRLIKDNFIYIKPFNKTISLKFCHNLQKQNKEISSNFIWKYSKGHLGTIKFLVQKIERQPDENQIFNKKLFNSFTADDALLFIWIKQMFSQFSTDQKYIINQFLNNNVTQSNPRINQKIINSTSFKDLKKLGMFKNNSENTSFLFEEFIDLIKKVLKENKNIDVKGAYEKTINGINTTLLLSKDEQLAFNCLLNNEGNCVSYEKLAETIWGDKIDEKYSLWALNKLISRLRIKIQKAGLPKKTIRTIRGKGYGWFGI